MTGAIRAKPSKLIGIGDWVKYHQIQPDASSGESMCKGGGYVVDQTTFQQSSPKMLGC